MTSIIKILIACASEIITCMNVQIEEIKILTSPHLESRERDTLTRPPVSVPNFKGVSILEKIQLSIKNYLNYFNLDEIEENIIVNSIMNLLILSWAEI